MKLKRLWPWREYQVIHGETGVIICTIEKSILRYWKIYPHIVPRVIKDYDLPQCEYYKFVSKEAAVAWIEAWAEANKKIRGPQLCQNL